ncbi:DUF1800 family protein [Kribbella sp. VKM Ac-2568]|uniref:DUF1800 domain-containing protein n=1 Tax=Kribbella sp. VKM Ac-2568 TaxID=2512219 RepID=UPI001046D15E|nr:DUF1800 domain-containing protein [Kribbella sp. VKM Ac-2568]TCM51455.1 uncharacterized protein (DUF1800 family) [Kribbella sp. VKM Ac-2568]
MGEISERSAVRRLCDRLGFGPAPGELDAGFEATLARRLSTAADAATTPPPVLTPPQPTKAPRKGAKQKGADENGADQDKTAADRAAKKAANKARAAQEAKLIGWWLDRMVASDRATERLTWFWHGHFATSNQKVRSAPLMLAQNQTFRTHARGSFTDLAQALVVDAAMIRWLDGNDNREGSPNENLAREFLELFTLGIGHYSEVDVFEGARALTGWTVRRTSAKAVFVPARHDSGDKTILGKSGEFGAKEFVDLALAKPESAEFVIGRLWFRLVSSTPPSAETVRRLVAAYGSKRDIGAVLKAMVAEAAFRDSASALVKQPVEWAVGLMRALGIQPAKLDDKTRVMLLAALRGMGQLPLRPPSVGGWPSGASWLTTSAGVTRLRLAQLLARKAELGQLQKSSARVDGVRVLLGVDAWSSRTKDALAGLTDPAQLTAVAACAPEYVVSG